MGKKTDKDIFVYEDKNSDLKVTLQDVKEIFGKEIKSFSIEKAEALGEYLVDRFFEEANEIDFDMSFCDYVGYYKKDERDFKMINKLNDYGTDIEEEEDL